MEMLLTLLGISFVPVTLVLTALWRSERARARRAEGIVHDLTVVPALQGRPAAPSSLTGTVEAIALEVERIAEGQRFLSKVLAERAPGEAAPRRHTPR